MKATKNQMANETIIKTHRKFYLKCFPTFGIILNQSIFDRSTNERKSYRKDSSPSGEPRLSTMNEEEEEQARKAASQKNLAQV